MFQFIVKTENADFWKVFKLKAIAVIEPVALVLLNPLILKKVTGYFLLLFKVWIKKLFTLKLVWVKKFFKSEVKKKNFVKINFSKKNLFKILKHGNNKNIYQSMSYIMNKMYFPNHGEFN